ncbi:MAG: UDP-N-acetylmuramate--L-alanine ligase [Bacteroidetes bacterium]|nr:UDP-N-acetylmuramate--L-alanine ligase [Bacteroidota bacterium]MBU1719534.1 UDP-N-acetylmuramate--L-alanine ligase [Bacteroidota bacterium]
MFRPDNIKSVYLIGIGGIGMSALARYFLLRGCSVSGYDKTPTALTSDLAADGIFIHFDEEPSQMPEMVDLIIHTPAIPRDSVLLAEARHRCVWMMKRAEVLGAVVADKRLIAVAGTHGKTSTCAMIGHIMKFAGKKCVSFIGGITTDYNSNLLFDENAEWAVAEADEYDKSFLQFNPEISVITSIDEDHLDIYGGKDELIRNFNLFASQTKPGGTLVLNQKLRGIVTHSGTQVLYSEAECEGCFAAKHWNKKGNLYFKLIEDNKEVADVNLGSPVLFNIQNAIAAYIATKKAGVPEELIFEALKSYSGVKRRFEIVLKSKKNVLIDDYAHHPEEIRACIESARSLYPNFQITVVFQPHLYSRTRDLAQQFAASLSLADELYLLGIYPAREAPISGITSEVILKSITIKEGVLSSLCDVTKDLVVRENQVVIIMGAGDIDAIVGEIQRKMKSEIRRISCA